MISDRTLVIRRGGLGDFILALPVLEALQQRFTGLHLEVMGPPSMIPLALRSGHIQGAKSAEAPGLSTFYGDEVNLAPDLSEYFRTFNLIILLGVDPGGWFSRNMKKAGVQKVAVIPPFPPDGIVEHVSDYLVRLTTGIPRANSPRVHLFRDELRTARKYMLSKMEGDLPGDELPALVAIHPGSGGAGKIWPLSSMARVARGLIHERRAVGVILIQGPADEEYAEVLRRSLDGVRVIPASNLSLLELAAILRSARLFLGSDSGVAHLAAAVGVPTGVIFGPTDPRRWAPRGPDVAIIRREIPCAPCGLDAMRTCQQRSCLREVMVEEVLNTARSLLQYQ
jgi:heptosyltransferase-3